VKKEIRDSEKKQKGENWKIIKRELIFILIIFIENMT
jgi:hypothetical protein